MRRGRRPPASNRWLELAHRRPELADLDRVAGNAHPEARLAELVDFAILTERALIEEGDAIAADARLAVRAAQLVVVAAKLRRRVALGHAGPLETHLVAVTAEPIALDVASAVGSAGTVLAHRARPAALDGSPKDARRYVATDRNAQAVVGAFLSKETAAGKVDPSASCANTRNAGRGGFPTTGHEEPNQDEPTP